MIKYGWIEEIVDVKTSFLYGNIEEEIHPKIPTGLDLITGENYNTDHCLILLKAIYGLVQVSQHFYKKLICVTTKNRICQM